MLNCRICKNKSVFQLIDLGVSPLANSLLEISAELDSEFVLPLKVVVCDKCFFTQLSEQANPKDIFNDKYVYYSGFSKTWKEHCKKFTQYISERFL